MSCSNRYEYRKVPKFSESRKLGFNELKIQIKRPNHRVIRPKDANGMTNSADLDQTAPSDCLSDQSLNCSVR